MKFKKFLKNFPSKLQKFFANFSSQKIAGLALLLIIGAAIPLTQIVLHQSTNLEQHASTCSGFCVPNGESCGDGYTTSGSCGLGTNQTCCVKTVTSPTCSGTYYECSNNVQYAYSKCSDGSKKYTSSYTCTTGCNSGTGMCNALTCGGIYYTCTGNVQYTYEVCNDGSTKNTASKACAAGCGTSQYCAPTPTPPQQSTSGTSQCQSQLGGECVDTVSDNSSTPGSQVYDPNHTTWIHVSSLDANCTQTENYYVGGVQETFHCWAPPSGTTGTSSTTCGSIGGYCPSNSGTTCRSGYAIASNAYECANVCCRPETCADLQGYCSKGTSCNNGYTISSNSYDCTVGNGICCVHGVNSPTPTPTPPPGCTTNCGSNTPNNGSTNGNAGTSTNTSTTNGSTNGGSSTGGTNGSTNGGSNTGGTTGSTNQHTYLNLALQLMGIGKGGNLSPHHTNRFVHIQIYKATDDPSQPNIHPVLNLPHISITYNSNTGYFSNNQIDLGTKFPSGTYHILVKSPGYMRQFLYAHQDPDFTINNGDAVTLPATQLITGDVVALYNQMDISDFYALVGCYKDKATTSSCSAGNQITDLNDDGVVDGVDLNIWLIGFNTLLQTNHSTGIGDGVIGD